MIPTRGPQNHIPPPASGGGRDMEAPQSGTDVGRG